MKKRVLFIGPKFFNYEKYICQELLNLGFEADYFDERPGNSFLTKVLIRINFQFLISLKIKFYYNKILKATKNIEYSHVFIVSPETLNHRILTQLRSENNSSKFILYMWDSFKNKNSIKLIPFFDRVLTFDDRDSNELNIIFLPLFYTHPYQLIDKNPKEFPYDMCSFGTAHSDRYKITSQVLRNVESLGLRVHAFHFLSHRILYWLRKFFIPKYNYGNIKDFSFRPLNPVQIINLVSLSRVILDVNHPEQHGLTSRSIEALGARRKLVTTNSNIKKYEFFNKNNIYIISRDNPEIDVVFFSTPYVDIDEHVYNSYSLNSWLSDIFDDQFKGRQLNNF